jgi:hypothetical protein
MSKSDAFSPFDPIINGANIEPPWVSGQYIADKALLRNLLSIPISQGDKQESGRPAKALDAWIANELRRAGFPAASIWPRTRRPRVLPEGLAILEGKLEILFGELRAYEAKGSRLHLGLRKAIKDLESTAVGSPEAYILGDFYSKQIDVGLSSWRRGPDVLISTKTMFGSFRKNLRNRHEEAVGEVYSLRRRHPMATMGYVYLVRDTIFEEEGAYSILHDILVRLRRPGEAFDATMLMAISWDDSSPSIEVKVDEPDEQLGASRFFTDMICIVETRSPVREHERVRELHAGQTDGGPSLGVLDDEDGQATEELSEPLTPPSESF